MLGRLEREHKIRLEKQQQEYEDYMHDLEDKMKRRFDDYLTLTNGCEISTSFSSIELLFFCHLVFKNPDWTVTMTPCTFLVCIAQYPLILTLADTRVIPTNLNIDH